MIKHNISGKEIMDVMLSLGYWTRTKILSGYKITWFRHTSLLMRIGIQVELTTGESSQNRLSIEQLFNQNFTYAEKQRIMLDALKKRSEDAG